MIKTIHNLYGSLTIKYHPRYSVICSEGHAPFGGIIDIEYIPADKLLEFESFEEWLFLIAKTSETIESLCRLVFDKLIETLGEVSLSVTVNAETQVHSPVQANIKR